MPPEFCLIAHAAQGDPVELPPQGSGDGATERRLPDAWRPVKAKDWPLHATPHLLHSQEFKDPLLDFFEAAMIRIKHSTRVCKVEAVFRALRPWQAGQKVQVGVRHSVFRMHRLERPQAPQFTFCNPLSILCQGSLGKPLAELRDFISILCLITLISTTPLGWRCVSITVYIVTVSLPPPRSCACPDLLQILLYLVHLSPEHHLPDLLLSCTLQFCLDLIGDALSLHLPFE
mmetsp:Transcript_88826/g.176600  ORF Transcript_88826/g.176600 Transcript_88826/m.176600 type:complete len:231 (-) Transcript_88826:694-1386(-)